MLKIIQLKFIMGIFFLCFSLMSLTRKNADEKVSFEPQAWNELGFNWNEYVWSEFENPCSPNIDMLKMNTVSMSIPEKIRASKKGIAKIPVPICVSFCRTEYRYYKYSNPEYEKMIHIKSLDETESVFLHCPIERIVKYNGEQPQEVLAPDPLREKYEKERFEMIQKCKELPDKMLDEGFAYGVNLTFNLSDYMDEPLQCGKYEIYFTYLGLESEHRIVEIAYKK